MSVSNLSAAAKVTPTSVLARRDSSPFEFKSGIEVLNNASKQDRIAVRGGPGVGKTRTIFDWAQDFTDRCVDDDHIRDVFGHWAKEEGGEAAIQEILDSDEAHRREILSQALRVVILDWDNRGSEMLFAGMTCDARLYNAFSHEGISSWEDGHRAVNTALDALTEHAFTKGWGIRGCLIAIDNMQSAWSEAASDYTYAYKGMSYAEIRSLARRLHPGKDKAARKEQNKDVFKAMDWKEVSDSHKEFFKPVLESPFNILLLAPSKTRTEKTWNELGEKVEEEVEQLGGAKQLLFDAQWIIHKGKTAGGQFICDWDKTRFTGMDMGRLIDPKFGRIRAHQKKKMEEHLLLQKAQFARKEYAEGLPNLKLISNFATLRDNADRIQLDDFESPLAKIPEGMPLPPPPPAPIMPPPNSGLGPMPVPPIPVAPLPPPPPPMGTISAPMPPPPAGGLGLPPPPTPPTSEGIKFSKDGFLALVTLKEEIELGDLEEYWGEGVFNYDKAEQWLDELLAEDKIIENSAGKIKLNVGSPDLPPPPAPAATPAPAPTPKYPTDGSVQYRVGKNDKGRGSFHTPNCAIGKRSKESMLVADPGPNRAPCKKCKPDKINEAAEEVQSPTTSPPPAAPIPQAPAAPLPPPPPSQSAPPSNTDMEIGDEDW